MFDYLGGSKYFNSFGLISRWMFKNICLRKRTIKKQPLPKTKITVQFFVLYVTLMQDSCLPSFARPSRGIGYYPFDLYA